MNAAWNAAPENPAKKMRSRRTRVRSGAAFLILVVLVLLVVIGSTQTLVRSELTARRSEVDRIRVRSMLSAIDAAQKLDADPAQVVRFPLDDAGKAYIETSINEAQSHLIARWVEGDTVVDEVRRKIELNVESRE